MIFSNLVGFLELWDIYIYIQLYIYNVYNKQP